MTAEDDAREALAEIVARAIRASRYSGKMVATPQPPEWHNPVDLRNGRRAVDAILASDVWRNLRQGPPSDDEREALTKVLLGVHPDTVLHDWGPRVIDARQNAERVIAAGFRRQGPITPPSDDEAHPARFDRFLCADCGEPITTQRVRPTSTSEWWVHVSDLGPGRSAVPSTTEQEKP